MFMALQEKYDVFLSFRGEDTRTGFTSHLYDALCRQTIKTFIDTQLPKGEEIPSTLLDTIKASRISVVIFSANYAESRWCLQELEAILDCRKTSKQIVIPVFYRVDPSHVRNQSEGFGAGFAGLQNRFKDQLKRWKDALSETANLAGHVVDDKKSESELVKDIVDDISSRIEIVGHPALLPSIEFSAPKDFELFQSSKVAFDQIIGALRNDETSLVGLYGMGGSGKTTLAKKVGIEVKEKGIFDEVVIVVVSRAPNFKDIQKKLAVELGLQLKEEDDEEHRAKQLYLRFTKTNTEREKKSLVILDDIWRKFDLKSKIGFPFGEGKKHCKILLTTRRQQLCSAIRCQQEIPLNLLNEDEGLTLLKRNAGIDDGSFTSELKALAIEVARECNGLPLPIVTIGSALKDKGVDEWKLVSQKLKKSKLVDLCDIVDLDENVYACLKVSYDYLENENTKLCFLLCSLFPEDHEISVEELIVYVVGQGLFSDAAFIEDARRELRLILKSLQAACLLLDADDECVKMHDMVRNVALWIASEGQNVFMTKSGMELTDWSNVKGWEQYTAISLWSNEIEELPFELVCPKLEILFLGCEYRKKLKVPDECFKEMKALKVLSLESADLSLKSLEFLTNLKTLELSGCDLRDISYLEKLNKLEILYLQGGSLDELPREVGELRKLRSLDFNNYGRQVRIPSNLIRMCSQLEELSIHKEFKLWEVEDKSEEMSCASLFELKSLSRLVSLRLNIDATSLPKDFAFPRLQRYDIRVNRFYRLYGLYDRTLEISGIEATSLVAFKALYGNMEDLSLEKTTGFQNILPNIDHDGFNELKSLDLEGCSDLTCVINTSLQDVPGNAFTNLVELRLRDLSLLRDICYGGSIPRGFLEKLETACVTSCPDIRSLFSTELVLRLYNLKKVKISSCEKLQELFQFRTEGLSYTALLPSLTKIKLEHLPKLEYIWKGPTQHINLQSLKSLYIGSCEILEYVFPISIARGLGQLEKLTIKDARQLKEVFFMDHESEENARDGIDIDLPKLRELRLVGLSSLANFLPENFRSIWPALEVLHISKCSNLTTSFVSQVNIRDQKLGVSSLQNLSEVYVSKCHKIRNLFSSTIAQYLLQLKKLTIEECEELEQIIFKDDEEGCDEMNGKEFVLLPQLMELSLKALPKLTSICPTGFLWKLGVSSLRNLTKVHINKCHRISNLFSSTLAQYLLQLEELTMEECDELEQIILKDDEDEVDDKEIVLLPKLKYLSLKALPKLTSFCPAGFILNLEILRMEDLDNDQMVGEILNCLRDVKELRIAHCVVKELKGLSKLTTLNLWNCDTLRHIVLSNLLQLQELCIGGCEELEEINIVEDKDEDEENDIQHLLIHKDKDRPADDVRSYHKQLELPQLQFLYLRYLPSLAKFCPVNYHLIFPSLENLIVEGCGKLETKFWYSNRGENGKGSVLAEAKTPQDDEDPQQGDICCLSSKAMVRELPLFEYNQQKE